MIVKRTLYLLALSILSFSFSYAQACIPTGSTHPTEGAFIDGQWTAYVYDLNGSYNSTNFVYSDYLGYYVDAGYGSDNYHFDSRDYWATGASPSNPSNTTYQGCAVSNDFHMVSYRRKGFPSGTYRLNVRGRNGADGHDDSARILINGVEVWSHTGCCDTHGNVWTGQLQPTDEVELVWMERQGASYGALKVHPYNPDPEVFGNGIWRVAVYADRNFNNYAGYYTENTLDFNTNTTWGSTNAPSDAPGYSGTDVNPNDHAFIYRREGFPCGFYQIDIPRYDDDVVLTIDGVVEYSDNSWDGGTPTPDVWRGYLDANSTIEFSIQEDGGNSIGALAFINLYNNTNDYVWTGSVSSDVFQSANWCPSIPNYNGSSNIIIPGNVTNFPVLNVNYGGGIGIKDFILQENAIATIGGITLNVNGNIQNEGTLNLANANLNLAGANLQTISGNGFDLLDLTVNNTNDVIIDANLNGTLNLHELLDVTAGTLITGGKIYMRCNFGSPTKTAQIAPVGGTINGDITTEQCFSAQRAFRLVNSSVNTSTSIHDNWQEGAVAWNDNPNPGYGTHITGTTVDQTNGLDVTPSGNPSMFRFDNVSQNWITVTDTENNQLAVTTPYLLMIRGDRSTDITSNAAAASNTKLRAKGSILQGNQTYTDFNATADAYNLFSNPYHAAVDMIQVMANSTNVNTNHYTIWDPTISTRGAYVTIDLSDASSNPVGSDANQFLQPMQSAFFQTIATGGAPVLNFTENNKNVAVAPTTTMRNQMFSYINLKLYSQSAFDNNENPADGLRINFGENFDNNKTMRDAEKIFNLDENLARSLNGETLALEYRALPESEEVLPLKLEQYRESTYTFAIEISGNLGYQAYLKDNYLEESTALDNGLNHISFNVDSEQSASIAPDRFAIVFGEENLGTDSFEEAGFAIYPNPLTRTELLNVQLPQSWTDNTQFVVYNMLGQKVFEHSSSADEVNSLNLEKLQTGVYTLSVTNKAANKTLQTKFVKN